jgi:Zn-dependent protease
VFSNPQQFIITSLYLIPGLLLGLVLHEYAHARVAVARGDQTPRADGRLSLDPSHHLDPLGTIAIFLIHFGWAKPVRINPSRMRHRYDAALVALAGPLTNLLIAIALSIPLRVLLAAGITPAASFIDSPASILTEFLLAAFYLNIVLAVFNVLPIPPLDGYNLVATLLRRRFPKFFFQVDANRQVITLVLVLIVFFLPGVLGSLIGVVYAPASAYLLGGSWYPF